VEFAGFDDVGSLSREQSSYEESAGRRDWLSTYMPEQQCGLFAHSSAVGIVQKGSVRVRPHKRIGLRVQHNRQK
jgi:hypothetical protein